jgi:hypothetical protein
MYSPLSASFGTIWCGLKSQNSLEDAREIILFFSSSVSLFDGVVFGP